MSKFVSLSMILGADDAELAAVKEGTFTAEKLGTIPYTALEYSEYKAAKKSCVKMVPNGKGGMTPELDDDKLMIEVILAAVDKDKRSDFTFANKELLKKLGVITAAGAVEKLLQPGEIINMAIEIQNLSGFGEKAQEDRAEEVKNF